MSKSNPYPPEKQLPIIPFDIAEWDDLPDPYPDGLFDDDADRAAWAAKSGALPTRPPKPPH